jgi:hypothetical protein
MRQRKYFGNSLPSIEFLLYFCHVISWFKISLEAPKDSAPCLARCTYTCISPSSVLNYIFWLNISHVLVVTSEIKRCFGFKKCHRWYLSRMKNLNWYFFLASVHFLMAVHVTPIKMQTLVPNPMSRQCITYNIHAFTAT